MNKFYINTFLAVVFVFIFLLAPFLSLAEIPQSPLGPKLDQNSNVGRDQDFGLTEMVHTVTRLVNWFAWFIAVASVAMGLYSGMLFITSRGNTAQLDTARKILIYTVIGIIVAIISFSIVKIASIFIGVN